MEELGLLKKAQEKLKIDMSKIDNDLEFYKLILQIKEMN